MTANPETLEQISAIIRAEVPKYFSSEFVVNSVTAENRPGPNGEDYVFIRVVIEDDHPKLDHPALMRFHGEMDTLFQQSGIPHRPHIIYTDRSHLKV